MSDDRDVVLDRTGAAGRPRQARIGAALFDLIVVPWGLGGLAPLLLPLTPGDLSLLVLWAVLVAVEGTLGRSPGKIVVGLSVQRLDDPRRGPGLVGAALRRPWGLPLLAAPFGPVATSVATLAALLVLVWMLVTVLRSDDGRGFHDRLAGTVVVDGPFDRRARLTVIITVVLLAVLSLVLAASVAPDTTLS